MKAKIGYPSVQEDVAVIRAIRQAVGDGVAIMVDYNQCLTPVEAVERLRVLDDEGLTWVEEPTLAHDYAGHALIAREAKTPIQCGENWWGLLDLRHAIDAGASDFIMPDVMKIGGVTGWLRAAALAQANGIRVSSHIFSGDQHFRSPAENGAGAATGSTNAPTFGTQFSENPWRSRTEWPSLAQRSELVSSGTKRLSNAIPTSRWARRALIACGLGQLKGMPVLV